MNEKKITDKVWRALLDTVELYVPFATFVVLFVVFLLAIVFRYFFTPLRWTFEITMMCFIWTVLLSAGYAWRKKAHVSFRMIYDLLGERGQSVFRIISNILILIACACSALPAWRYLQDYMSEQTSAAFGIRFNVIYFPIVPFFLFITGHAAFDLFQDFKKLLRIGKSK